MKERTAQRLVQAFRGASLILPSAPAALIGQSPLGNVVIDTLGPLWLATFAALVVRAVGADVRRPRARTDSRAPSSLAWLDAIDVLTATGCSMAWLGAAAMVASVWAGWASLSVVGLFGLVVVHLVALWTLLVAGGNDPWRRASLTRRFVPGTAVEGDAVTEELRFAAPRIPVGFRLFVRGRVAARWPLCRHAVRAADSRGEIVLESDVGPAFRGDYEAEPLDGWLQDVFGLCHSPRVRAGDARLLVLPRRPHVDGTRPLLGLGGHDEDPRPAVRLPTTGSFDLREYKPGDDVRRIHWLRSLTARQIVVRLPDELPSDEPSVRLVLDTFHLHFTPPCARGASELADELLDALVVVWLGVGRALADAGLRVTLVTAAPRGDAVVPARERLSPRGMSRAERLGASVRWQDALSPGALLTKERSLVVSHRLPVDAIEGAARWVVVPAELWTPFREPRAPLSTACRLAHPIGSADNRWSRTGPEHARRARARGDYGGFLSLSAHSHARRAGNLVARPTGYSFERIASVSHPTNVWLEVLR